MKQDSWKIKKLGEVAEINPRKPPVLAELPSNHLVTFVPMAAVDEQSGTIAKPDVRAYAEVKKGFTYFSEGDVIFAKITPCMQNGKAAIASGLKNGLGFGSTEFHVIRPLPGRVIPEWIWFFVRQPLFRVEAALHFRGSAGQQRVPDSFLAEHEIPVPSIEVQQRVVGRLRNMMERVDEIRGLCRDVSQSKSLIVKMFLRERYDSLCESQNCVPLDQLVQAFGGGTPSKKRPDYWQGAIPWVSPKDMKVHEIVDATDHISQEGIDNSSTRLIEPPAVLFVVRGMILAHTLPVAVSRVPVTINQDMKALKPRTSMSANYLAHMIRGAAGYLLHDVEIAGHGTCRLKTEIWSKLPIPVLRRDDEDEFVASISAAERVVDDLRTTTDKEVTAITQAILRKAFAGEL